MWVGEKPTVAFHRPHRCSTNLVTFGPWDHAGVTVSQQQHLSQMVIWHEWLVSWALPGLWYCKSTKYRRRLRKEALHGGVVVVRKKHDLFK